MFAELIEKEYHGKPKDAIYYSKLELANNTDARLRLINILSDDARIALEELQLEPQDQYRQRTLVRTLFANIEGQISLFKQNIIDWFRAHGCTLTKGELEKLVDKPTIFETNPEISVFPKRLSLKDNIKFTFEIYALKLGELNIKIDSNDRGWDSFCKAIVIRDGLMHPKSERDINLSETKIKTAIHAWLWFNDVSTKLRVEVSDRFQAILSRKINDDRA